ncbi:DUF1249 domain-containing protein [Thiohalocapsa marina]|uniref:DUF1249 domain-containing protein n=1 Tax=Thiohalocapsa marina TaxID=424902 RepID=A0A5M8FF58_9GAMM|nr:DUF1249 domain-containing protein [Thiohalocapsa marina]KAA6183319.1 DUF1249 domain-containing protein [Thiohalocapsa marina]
MQSAPPLLATIDLTGRHPTVGGLMQVCEENYQALDALAPGLAQLHGRHLSHEGEGIDLLLEVREQARYTTLFRLTHLFPTVPGSMSDAGLRACARPTEPDAVLKAYHDAGQVEVLDLRQTVLPLLNHYQPPALQAKWKVNLFLSKWLAYCLHRGHRFPASARVQPPRRRRQPAQVS